MANEKLVNFPMKLKPEIDLFKDLADPTNELRGGVPSLQEGQEAT